MDASAVDVVHVFGADASVAKLDVLGELCATACVVKVGGGKPALDLPRAPIRLRAPFDAGWLGARALRRLLDERVSSGGRSPIVLHVWSPKALGWCAALADSNLRLLVEVEAGMDLPGLARWYTSRRAERNIAFVSPTAIGIRRLVERGVAGADCALIREFVDFGRLNRAPRERIRERLGFHAADRVIAVAPPSARRAGTYSAAWAALLLREVRGDVRLLVEDDGAEGRRVRRMVESCGERAGARFTRGLSRAELFTAADLAAYLPPGDAPLGGVVWAMAASRPIVASAVPAVAELLAHGDNAWLCRADDPRDAARRMLQALEQPEQSRQQAERARAQAFKIFGRQRMIEQYQRAQENLAGGRGVADGIRDSALVS